MSKTNQETYQVKGMHCASCASVIEHKVKKIEGVVSIAVNLATDTATINTNRLIPLATLNQSIQPFGYELSKNISEQKTSPFPYPFLIAVVAFLFMIWETLFGLKIGIPKPPGNMWQHNFFLFILASVNLFVFGRQFLQAIPRFIKTRYANMDTLVGIGTGVAYLYSLAVLFFGSQVKQIGLPDMVFFDVTVVVIGFILFGKQLEAQSKTKTGEAIQKLLELQAKTALVIRDGQEIEVSIKQIIIGDQVIIKPGTSIPVDGVIVKGNTSINESMITGESMPVDKQIGDTVIGGTRNIQGSIICKVNKIGADTMLAKIIRQVIEAQQSKAPIEAIADRVAAIFVPIVLVISVLTFIVWFITGNLSLAISGFIGVLVIACPCALGLATPTGIIVGVGKGAENGILVKDASSLEQLAKLQVLIMDKTGTLTTGKPTISSIIGLEATEKEVLQIAASLEKNSEHPLSQAIVAAATAKKYSLAEVTDFKNLEGKGVSGVVNGKLYYAGSKYLMNKLGITSNGEKSEEKQGKTPVYVSETGKKLLGIIYIADTLKPEAVDVVHKLQTQGIQVTMATGDDQDTAAHIAKLAGINKVHAEVLPSDKAEVIKQYQHQGYVVGMVGDGINDAPALAQADIGIAMSTGTDIAIESASITLLHGDITKIFKAIQLSKATMDTIRQNLFWAFIYNVIGIPVAAGLLYPLLGIQLNPMYAGAAMALSSVSVVTNSLRLKTVRL